MSSEQVQVEARTLSGVHLGREVSIGGPVVGLLTHVAHERHFTAVELNGEPGDWALAPTDLVTLTGGGGES